MIGGLDDAAHAPQPERGNIVSPEVRGIRGFAALRGHPAAQAAEARIAKLQQVERRRAKTSENISAAVLSNLVERVMFLTPNGLVRQANAAAQQILGFASPVGMTAAQIFREAE